LNLREVGLATVRIAASSASRGARSRATAHPPAPPHASRT
jgi:hypothetical protein